MQDYYYYHHHHHHYCRWWNYWEKKVSFRVKQFRSSGGTSTS